MRVRFQADADLDGRILRGLRRTAPEINIRTAADAELDGVADPDVLRIAADSGRLLVSQDRRTRGQDWLFSVARQVVISAPCTVTVVRA